MRKFLMVAALLASPIVAAAQQINTGTPNSSTFYFGGPNTATYGQTFVAPDFFRLSSFTFQLTNGLLGNELDFNAYICAWEGTRAVRPLQYGGGARDGTGSSSPQTYTFSPGGTALVAGQTYVAFLSASPWIAAHLGVNRTQELLAVNNGSFTDGQFVHLANGGDFSQITTTAWNTSFVNTDLAFTATFINVVPEPSTYTLRAIGLGAIAFLQRRRRTLKSR